MDLIGGGFLGFVTVRALIPLSMLHLNLFSTLALLFVFADFAS
jgi:hypothetical protein